MATGLYRLVTATTLRRRLLSLETKMQHVAFWRFLACCSVPLCVIAFLLVIITTAYVEMDQAVVIARQNTCPPDATSKIPRVLHQTWRDKEIPEKWSNSSASCRKLNPEYDLMFWTDDDIEAFLLAEYPWFVDTYYSYPHKIQRIDAARLFMLYHYGGVYTDLDIICRHSFQHLLRNLSCYNLVFLETTPVGVTNMVIFAAPRHPFIKKCLEALPGRNHMWGPKHVTVMLSAGPTFISHMMRNYPEMSDMFVYSLSERHALFGDLLGQSWHGTDTKMFTVIDHHLKVSIVIIASIIFLLLYFTYQLCFRVRSPLNLRAYVLPSQPNKRPDMVK